ncbi:MAG: GntR family transcriptional regulator [Acidimicrobiia bacterium]
MLDGRDGPDVFTKKQYAADWLREMVVSGDLEPGARIRQQHLADRLGISATPVREAILQLEVEGYLELIPHVGVRVAALDDDHGDEVTDLRKLLEGQLSRVACEVITDAQVDELKRFQQAFEDAVRRSDPRVARRTNYQLHRCIWGIADRVVTQRIVQGLWARVPWRALDDTAIRGSKSVVEHHDLVEALVNRNPGEAESATHRHIDSSRNFMRATGQ